MWTAMRVGSGPAISGCSWSATHPAARPTVGSTTAAAAPTTGSREHRCRHLGDLPPPSTWPGLLVTDVPAGTMGSVSISSPARDAERRRAGGVVLTAVLERI